MASISIETVSDWLRISNTVYIIACTLAVVATFGVVYFGGKYTLLRERELEEYKRQADLGIAQANAVAASAQAAAERARAEQEMWKVERAELELRLAAMEDGQSRIRKEGVKSNARVQTLEDWARPRAIEEAQQVLIGGFLASFKDASISLGVYSQDDEALRFGRQVSETLRLSGLNVQDDQYLGKAGTGFGVFVSREGEPPPLALAILNAFQAAGIEIDLVRDPDDLLPAGEIQIVVGAREPRK